MAGASSPLPSESVAGREGVDEGDAVGVAQPVVQGEERSGLDALQGEPVRGT